MTRAAARRAKAGHPWIFEGDVTRVAKDAPAGTTATVYDPNNRLCAIGLWDPTSPIRVRVLGPAGTQVDDTLFVDRIEAARVARAPLEQDADTDGYRVVHGPNDGMPGVVVDRYADTLVLKLYSAIWAPRLDLLVSTLGSMPGIARVVLRLARNVGGAFPVNDGHTLVGTPPRGAVVFRENGVRFEAEPVAGHKTGFFLDQRDNRARVETLSRGARVLNVFSYTGGFSLYAARGGARHVTSVDISGPATAAAERNFALNRGDARVAACDHRAVCGDAFEVMADLRGDAPFDVVIVDPPAFAKRAAELDRAVAAYERLVRAALALLRPGGQLVFASCSSRVTPERFVELVTRTARSVGRPLGDAELTGHALDHPISFDEAAYLKCVFARA